MRMLFADGFAALQTEMESILSSWLVWLTTSPLQFCAICFTFAVSNALLRKLLLTPHRSSRRPFDDIPYYVPHPHWFWGHLQHLGKGIVPGQRVLCVQYASSGPQGVSTFWTLRQPCFSTLDARLMRRLLQATSTRTGTRHQRRHFSKLFGPHSLLLKNGTEWKTSRQWIARVLWSQQSLQQQQQSSQQQQQQQQSSQSPSQPLSPMAEMARRMEQALLKAIANSEQSFYEKDGLWISRLTSLDVFGGSVLGHDFGGSQQLELKTESQQQTPQHDSILDQTTFLQQEFTRRCFHQRINLAAQWYNFPWDESNLRHQKMYQGLRATLQGILQRRRQELYASTKSQEESQSKSPSDTQSQPQPMSLVDCLLQAQHEGGDHGADWKQSVLGKDSGKDHATQQVETDDDMLADWLVTLLFGGFDTTALSLTYTLYLLAKHPEYQDLVAQEAQQVLGEASHELADPSQDLPFLNACIQESLRLYPPVTLTARNLDRPFTFDLELTNENGEKKQEMDDTKLQDINESNGHDSKIPKPNGSTQQTPTRKVTLPAGTRIMCSFYWIQHDKRNFARPFEFLPERWAQQRQSPSTGTKKQPETSSWEMRTAENDHHANDPEYLAVGNPHYVLAFSAGARNCVGQNLAQGMMPIILAYLLRHVRVELVDPEYSITMIRYGGNAAPAGGLPLKFYHRSPIAR